jgi:serine/threonine protein kinase
MAEAKPDTESLFTAALALESAAQRSQYLDQACGLDHQLRARVEELLAAYPRAERFLESPGRDLSATAADPVGERPGVVIGPYKLLEQIGEGGFGVVFMAEQQQPVRRKVALKVLKPGMDTRQVVARFEAERQALALMDHPNIAKVLDGGQTGSGRPYFVMDLVKGMSITEYCDQARLAPRERLELFVYLCQAVQHAHQKGVIHRDLKPSNILVALYDGRPVPKVIDFGVAKATGPRLTERTLCTELGSVVGTLEYMSPEQAELNPLDIDTRSDIYALGVLLYELLTGTTPLERQRLKQTTLLEALPLIREEEPPRPSTRLSTAEGLPLIAANRGVDRKRLSGLVRGELDWVVMKCLEKDRDRRYETANGLARDLERYLHDEPVQACPPSALYRFGKFARRNKGALLTVALVGVVLLAAVTVLAVSNARIEQAWQHAEANYRTAETQRREAEKNFQRACEAVEQMLSEVGPRELERIPQMEPVRRALLEKAVQLFEQFLDDPRADPVVRHRAGQAYNRLGFIHTLLGQTDRAIQDYARCRAIYQGLLAEFPQEPKYVFGLAITLNYDASSERVAGRFAEAERVARQALALAEKLPPDAFGPKAYRSLLANVYYQLGAALVGMNRLREAEHAKRQCLAWTEKQAGGVADARTYPRTLGAALQGLAEVLAVQGKFAAAAELLQRAIVQQKTVLQFNPWDLQARENLRDHYVNLGRMRGLEGKLDEAVIFSRQGLAVDEQRVADFPRAARYRARKAESQVALGLALEGAGNPGEAEALYRAAVPELEKFLKEFPDAAEPAYGLAAALKHLGVQRQTDGALAEAEPMFRRAVLLLEKLVAQSPEHVQYREHLAGIYNSLGNLLDITKRPEEAEAEYRKALAQRKKIIAERPAISDYLHNQGVTSTNLALVLSHQDRFPEARQVVTRGMRHTEAALKARPRSAAYREELCKQQCVLDEILIRLKRDQEAIDLSRKALPLAEELARERPELVQHRSVLAVLLFRVAYKQREDGRLIEARQLVEKAVSHQRFALAAQPANANYRACLRNQYVLLTRTLLQLRDHAEVAKTAVELTKLLPEGWKEYRGAAGNLAYCVALAAHDRKLALEARQRLIQHYADQAMKFLRQAVARGFKEASELQRDFFQQALGARADFRQLLAELMQPQP